MMNRMAAHESRESDGRELEHAEKVERRRQVVALDLCKLCRGFSVVFVVPLEKIRGSLYVGGHGTVASSFIFSSRDSVQKEALAGCDMPSQLQRAFRFRIRLPATLVGRDGFNDPPSGFLFISDLGEINLVQEKNRLIRVHP